VRYSFLLYMACVYLQGILYRDKAIKLFPMDAQSP